MKRDHGSRPTQARACVQAQWAPWPQGAIVGILLVAAACVGFSLALYHVAGPRDVFAEERASD
jgi:hypothetical protein